MNKRYQFIPIIPVGFYGLVVDEGEILISQRGPQFDFYTRSKGCSDLIFQFGCQLSDACESLDVAISNYEIGNLSFED